jgi:hypothetical protein
VIFAIVWDRTEQTEETPTKSNNPILIELKTLEGGKKASEESDELGNSLEMKEPKAIQNGDVIRQGTRELIIRYTHKQT